MGNCIKSDLAEQRRLVTVVIAVISISLRNNNLKRKDILQVSEGKMQPKNLLTAHNRNELRIWLAENYDKENECWVIVKRGRPKDNGIFLYIDAVEEAMCFGWIDSTEKKS